VGNRFTANTVYEAFARVEHLRGRGFLVKIAGPDDTPVSENELEAEATGILSWRLRPPSMMLRKSWTLNGCFFAFRTTGLLSNRVYLGQGRYPFHIFFANQAETSSVYFCTFSETRQAGVRSAHGLFCRVDWNRKKPRPCGLGAGWSRRGG